MLAKVKRDPLSDNVFEQKESFENLRRTLKFIELKLRFQDVFNGFQNLNFEQEQTNQLEFSMRNLSSLLSKSPQNCAKWDKYADDFNKLLVESERLIIFDKNNYNWGLKMKRLNESIEDIRQNVYDLKERIEYPKCKLKLE
jgi:hypothetical protein